ncbi:autotransporter [Mesorhizobium sp. B292B1B]|uniref:beta strand repeat-containing protein n=1 Tax=unclassified Mesorhizobium TaxID=325217 RepID=UPI0015E3DD32|nr:MULTISPECIES: autotransporter outer membrane beta-barrel domain-containing protein [unclassified Mesorhizobium]MCA0012043.1 autotransporter [Mesorhizobium sp. B294B1A1]MCA0038297.1 autotransporter [Mesorhizobium sp. B292B1B]
MRQGAKLRNTDGPALSLRHRFVLGSALATSAFLGGYRGYVRRASADCTLLGGTYTCGGTLTAEQALPDEPQPLTVTTVPGFSIDTRLASEGSGGNAFTLTGTGGLTFTDNYSSTIVGQLNGIEARNNGGGALSITTTGTVMGTAGAGLLAINSSAGTDLTIKAAEVTGGYAGISAYNLGSGELYIAATGAVKGATYSGIFARNYGTNLTIKVADVSGGSSGIVALNNGSGALSITATGAVSGEGMGYESCECRLGADGIYANNDGTNLTINAVDVSGASSGIVALNNGSGALSVTTTGVVSGAGAVGYPFTSYGSGGYGIAAINRGSGALSINATGSVTGTTNIGILADNSSGADLTISAANVSGGIDAIRALNGGTGSLSITATGMVTGNGGAGIYARNESAVTSSTTTVTVGSGATVSGTTVGIELVSGTGRAASVNNAGSIAGATGILANTAAAVTISNTGSITGTAGSAIDLTASAPNTINQMAGIISGNILLSGGSPDLVSVTGGTITGSVFGLGGGNSFNASGGTIDGSIFAGSQNDTVIISGTAKIQGNAAIGPDAVGLEDGDDTFRMTGGHLGSAVSGGNGNDTLTVDGGIIDSFVAGNDGADQITVSGGSIGGDVTGGSGIDQVAMSGGSIAGDVDAETVTLTGGAIGGNITGLSSLVINDPLSPAPISLRDGVVFSGTNAVATIIDTDLSAGGTKTQLFEGFDSVTVDPSTIKFGTGMNFINLLNLVDGSTLIINGNAGLSGRANVVGSTITMLDGVADDIFTLGGLALNNAQLGLDIDQQTVQADKIVTGTFSATGTNTILVNLLGTPQFAQATDIPIIVFASGPVTGTFNVLGIPGTPGSLFTYQLVTGPGGLFLRATPANFGIAAAPTSATNAGAVEVAIDAVYGINRDALDADLPLSPASGSGMVPVSSSFGVFASGQFAHTEHDGYNISGGGLNGAGPSFDANDFSAAISLDFNAAKHFQFDKEYGLNIGVFAGYASTDVSLGAFNGFDAIGEGTNKAGMFGGYALFRMDYNYALVSASGFFGGSDVTNGVLGTTGSYDTRGYAVTGSVGHIFTLGERTRFDLRGGLLGVSFRGDPYTDSGGNEFGKSQLSFGAIKLEPGIYGDYTLSNGMVFSPYARGELQQRFDYKNTTEIGTRKIDFDDADFSMALTAGFNLKISELTTVNGEVRGKASSDSSTIGAKLGIKIAF